MFRRAAIVTDNINRYGKIYRPKIFQIKLETKHGYTIFSICVYIYVIALFLLS